MIISLLNCIFLALAFSAPSLLALTSALSLSRSVRQSTELTLVFTGVSLITVHIAFGRLLQLVEAVGLSPFGQEFTVILVLVGLCSLFGILIQISRNFSFCRIRNASAPLTLLVICVFVTWLWSDLPAQGWDSLDFWLLEAREFLENNTESSTEEPFFYENRHPFSIIGLASFAGWFGAQSPDIEPGLTLLILWAIPWLSMGIIVYGYARYNGLTRYVSLPLAYAVLFTPLLENHFALPGYADIWLAASILAPVILMAIGLDSENGRIRNLGFLLLVLPPLAKNTGLIFSFSLLALFLIITLGYLLSFKRTAVVCIILGLLLTVGSRTGEPKVESVFTVAIDGKTIDFNRKTCPPQLLAHKFFIDITPINLEDIEDLVSPFTREKFAGRQFFTFFAVDDGNEPGKCRFSKELASYPKKYVRFGQMNTNGRSIWECIISPNAFEFSLGFLGVGLQVSEYPVVSAAGRWMKLELNSFLQVFRNQLYAFAVNQSLGLWFSALIFLSFLYILNVSPKRREHLLLICSPWLIFFVLATSQVFIDHSFRFATPERDTGNSRFSLSIAPLVAVLLAFVLAQWEHAVSKE